VRVRKLTRPGEVSQPAAPAFLMQASGKVLSPREKSAGVRLDKFDELNALIEPAKIYQIFPDQVKMI
jgi:hypothetical protein